MLTFLAQQEGVEAQVVDGQVEPALPGHAALPVAAGIVVDQLLPLRHPKLLPHLQLGLLELPRVLLSLRLQVLVLFCNDTLEEDKGTGSWQAQCSHGQDRQRQEQRGIGISVLGGGTHDTGPMAISRGKPGQLLWQHVVRQMLPM